MAVDEAVFSATEGDVVGPVNLGSRGVVVLKVERLQVMDPTQFEQEEEDVRSRLKGDRAQGLLRAMVDRRRRDTVVTVNNELMERFATAS